MPFFPPFNMPFFYNNYKYPHNPNIVNPSNRNSDNERKEQREKASKLDEASEAFFEIFGLKLYFDDVLIICILFFLYTEKVQDEELFICLILLLLT